MWNKILHCSFVSVFVFALIGWIGGWTRTMKAGNEAYSLQNYDEAQVAFQQATLDKPESPTAHYNLGTALYRQEKFREAARAFQVSLLKHTGQTKNVPHRAHVYYNMGNAQFKAGDLAGAIASYKHTLRLEPQDGDAQHNLALALQLMKQQEDFAQQQQANQNAPPKTEPNDIGRAEALRLLERFSENENRLRQKLLQEQRKSGYRRAKDW